MRRNPAEQRRAKHDAGKHLSDHTRLMHLPEESSGDSAYQQNHGDLQQQDEEVWHYWIPFSCVAVCLVA
jgi:hypothetical protein